MSKKRFRNRLIDVLRVRLPQARIQGSGDVSIAITELGGFERSDANLEIAYCEFNQNPATIDNILARWADVIISASTKSSAVIDVSTIVPLIKSRQWLADMHAYAARSQETHDI